MYFTHNTGGKEDAGLSHEHDDCVVRAWAIAKDLPYADVHAQCKALGRQDGKATPWHIVLAVYGQPTKEFFRLKKSEQPTVRKLMMIAANRTVIVHIERHVFCIKKGTQLDNYANKLNKKVDAYWIVE